MSVPEIRLVGLDLDGTVFTNDKRITPRTLAAIQKAIAKGVIVIPATGRPLSGLPEAFARMPGVEYALTSNGAAVWHLPARRKLVDLPLSAAHTLAAYALLEAFDCMPDVYWDGRAHTSPERLARLEEFAPPEMVEYVRSTRTAVPNLAHYIRENGIRAEKVTAFFKTPAQRVEAMEAAGQLPFLVPTSSIPNNIELNEAGVHKGVGLVKLAETLGFSAENVMACGDGGNDVEMLRAVGLGVAMGNAPDEVKRAARDVTDTNERDGVAKALEKWLKLV